MTDKKANISVDSVTFNMPTVTKDIINQNAVAKVNEFLPELDSKTKYFDRNNSQKHTEHDEYYNAQRAKPNAYDATGYG